MNAHLHYTRVSFVVYVHITSDYSKFSTVSGENASGQEGQLLVNIQLHNNTVYELYNCITQHKTSWLPSHSLTRGRGGGQVFREKNRTNTTTSLSSHTQHDI